MRTFFTYNTGRKRRMGRVRRYAPALVFVAVILGVLFVFPDVFSRFFGRAAAPVWRAGAGASSELENLFVAGIAGRSELLSENKALEEELREMEQQLLVLQSRSEEYEMLLNKLGRSLPERNYTLAFILSKPPKTLYDTLILDVGSRNGVLLGDVVYSHENIAVGEVVRVEGSFSHARLFSSPEEKIDVVLSDGIYSSAVGRGSGMFEVNLSKSVVIEEGEHVRLAQDGFTLLGSVEEVELREEETFQRVLVRSPFNLHEARYLLVENQTR